MVATSTSRPSRVLLFALTSLSALVVFAAGCSYFEEAPVLTAEDSGSSLVLISGDEFIVELESNPSTGYAWTLDGDLPANVEQVGEPEYIEADSDELGAPVTERWTFRAKAQGSGEVFMRCWRSFDPETENEDTFMVEVTVREP